MLEAIAQIWDAVRYLKLFYPLLLLGSLLLCWRSPRADWRARWALVGLAALSWMPVAWVNNRLLEQPYVGLPEPPSVDALVVLSGAALPPSREIPYSLLLDSTVRRTRHAAEIGSSRRTLPILVCGPGFEGYPGELSVAAEMGLLLEGWGIPQDNILLEEKGRSTAEQSIAAGPILRAHGVKRILVVTDAFHMRRALGCFRKQGFEAFPAPAYFRAGRLSPQLADLIPSPGMVLWNEEALREWLALAVYKARGVI